MAVDCNFCPCSQNSLCSDNVFKIANRTISDSGKMFYSTDPSRCSNRSISESAGTGVACQFCPLTFGGKSARDSHARLHHREEVAAHWHACHICNFYFPDGESLLGHSKLHSGDRRPGVNPVNVLQAFVFKDFNCTHNVILSEHFSRIYKEILQIFYKQIDLQMQVKYRKSKCK